MLGIVKLLQKKPSDKAIRTSKIIFGIILIASGYYNLVHQGDAIQNSIFWITINESSIIYVKYFIIALGLIPLLSGLLDICIMKSKYVRIFQILSGLVLFYIAGIIVDSPQLEIDTLIGFMGIFPLIGGITGKFITTKGSKYGYTVTKIRV